MTGNSQNFARIKLGIKLISDGVEHVKILNKRANDNFEAVKHRDDILEEGKMIKQFETFLETAPQTVLQLYIIFQLEPLVLASLRYLSKCLVTWYQQKLGIFMSTPLIYMYIYLIF